MKNQDLIMLGILGLGAFLLFKYFSGTGDFSFGGGGGGGGGGGYGGSAQTMVIHRDYTGKTSFVPIVQQAPNVITMGTKTQIGQPAYSGRSTPYIKTDITKPSQVQFTKDPIGSLRSMIGFQVGGYKYPVGTPQNPATPKTQTGYLIPLIRR